MRRSSGTGVAGCGTSHADPATRPACQGFYQCGALEQAEAARRRRGRALTRKWRKPVWPMRRPTFMSFSAIRRYRLRGCSGAGRSGPTGKAADHALRSMALRVTPMLPQSDSPAAHQRRVSDRDRRPTSRVDTRFPKVRCCLPRIRAARPSACAWLSRSFRMRLHRAPLHGSFYRRRVGRDRGGRACQRIVVPREAVVRRAEMTGVCVVRDGVATLRQVRLGARWRGCRSAVGVMAGEVVALDPQAAARHRLP